MWSSRLLWEQQQPHHGRLSINRHSIHPLKVKRDGPSSVDLGAQRERATQTGSVPPPAPEALREQLAALLPAVLFQGIQRHRLQSFLQSDPAVFELLPELQADFQNAIRSEAMAALALASLTREMAELFAKAGIPLLVIKGIPLALQTTGSMTARGRGDCDLFVAPSRWVRRCAAAISGIALTYGASCVGMTP